jgi:hypothetical protein
MVGSCVPPDSGVLPGSGATGPEAGISPAAGAEDAGAAAAGVSMTGDCAVCAKAPAQSDDSSNDVEASHIVRIPPMPQSNSADAKRASLVPACIAPSLAGPGLPTIPG